MDFKIYDGENKYINICAYGIAKHNEIISINETISFESDFYTNSLY